MGWFDGVRNLHRPAAGVVPQPAGTVYQAIMELNDPEAPFRIRDARDEQADLVAEWKVEHHRWGLLLSTAGMTRVTRTLMRLYPEQREVRSVDQERSVEWHAGIGHVSGSVSWGRGQINRSWGTVSYGRRPDGGFGRLTGTRFSSKQVKEPIQKAVTAAGWTWRGVSFGGL